ncbi:MAG: type III polyketide synthase [Flavobacteriales bacterium]|nr:type III polyketide synthase [Flavobacteriales bacterium]
MNPKVLAVASATPEHSENTEDIIKHVERWIANQDERTQKRFIKVFKNARVSRRYSIMSIEEVFTTMTFEERNNIYMERGLDLCENVMLDALKKANLKATDIDYIISTGCTGIMIPSIDAYLINRLGMRTDIVRMPITEMGCAAGVSATIYAKDILKANPGKKVAILAYESPTATFQTEDYSMTNAVSSAIFGDGAACMIMGDTDEVRPAVIDTQMYHFRDELHMMGFALKNSGLHIILDPAVPSKIEEHFPKIIFPFLEKNNIDVADLNHFIFHPGGKKIVVMVEELIGKIGKNIDDTKAVLDEFGNMSSATVLFVMERFLDKDIKRGELGLMLSFGPGFSAQTALLRWE